MVMLTIAVLCALLAGHIAPFDPFAMAAPPLLAPSAEHLMGTDHLGRDIFSRVLFGTQVSISFATGAAALSFVVGTTLGALPGYFGGTFDHLMSRFFEFFMMIPMLFLVILMSALLGANIVVAAFVVGITIWPTNARIARAQVMTLKNRMFVRAARASGAGHLRILFVHILPNGIQPLIVNSTLQVGAAILLEASLSFLGLGDPNYPSWGQMLRESQPYLSSQWTFSLFPGLAIGWLVIAVTLVGDGINHALNRTQR
jgi:peptide/nickel transport system permease protein